MSDTTGLTASEQFIVGGEDVITTGPDGAPELLSGAGHPGSTATRTERDSFGPIAVPAEFLERLALARKGWERNHRDYSGTEIARFIVNLTRRDESWRQAPWSDHVFSR